MPYRCPRFLHAADAADFDSRSSGSDHDGRQRWPRFGLKAQLDLHGPFYDAPLEEIGATTVELTFGAWMNRVERARLEFALVEDLRVSTAPDVVLRVAAQWSW